MRTHKAAPEKGPTCKPRAESHRGFLNQGPPKAELAFCVPCSEAQPQPLGHSWVSSSDLFAVPQPSLPAATPSCSQAHQRGPGRPRRSCRRSHRRRFGPGLCCTLGFIYSGSANSQDESETEERFIKKESIIISKKKKNKHLSVLGTAWRRLGLDSPGSSGLCTLLLQHSQHCCPNFTA